MLEVPLEWKKVPDLMMDQEDVLPKARGSNKHRREEISQGQRKQRKEDDIWPEKQGHSPTVSRRIQNPEEFYFKDWDEDNQEEDKWQAPDKWQEISQMVFCNGVLEIHLVEDRVISSLRIQQQGCGCSASEN